MQPDNENIYFLIASTTAGPSTLQRKVLTRILIKILSTYGQYSHKNISENTKNKNFKCFFMKTRTLTWMYWIWIKTETEDLWITNVLRQIYKYEAFFLYLKWFKVIRRFFFSSLFCVKSIGVLKYRKKFNNKQGNRI